MLLNIILALQHEKATSRPHNVNKLYNVLLKVRCVDMFAMLYIYSEHSTQNIMKTLTHISQIHKKILNN